MKLHLRHANIFQTNDCKLLILITYKSLQNLLLLLNVLLWDIIIIIILILS